MFQELEPTKRLCEAEVDNFFAEIDALGIPGEVAGRMTNDSGNNLESPSDSPPLPPPPPPPPPPPSDDSSHKVTCQWKDFIDPKTKLVYYYNSTTQETTWTMPDELKAVKKRSVKKEAVESGTSHKKKKSSSTRSKEMSKSVDEIEYLQEYVANSDTSFSSNGDSVNEKVSLKKNGVSSTSRNYEESRRHKRIRKRKKSRDKRSHSKRKKRKIERDPETMEEEDENLIGPRLPSDRLKAKVKDESVEEYKTKLDKLESHESRSPKLDNDETENVKRFIGPQLPTSDNDDADKADIISNGKSHEAVVNCDSSQFEEAQDELSEAIREQCSMLMNKLQFLNVIRDSIPLLHVLFIKLEARFEDWNCGALTLERMVSTLNETTIEMTNYENSAVPTGWKCFWDNSTNRYYYENQVTKECQWEYPNLAVPLPDMSALPSENYEGRDTSEAMDEKNEHSSLQSPASQEVRNTQDNEEICSSRTAEKVISDNENKSDSLSDEEPVVIDSLENPTSVSKVELLIENEEEKEEEKEKVEIEIEMKQTSHDDHEFHLIEGLMESEEAGAIEDAEVLPMQDTEPTEPMPTTTFMDTTTALSKACALRLVAYDDDDDSESSSEDANSQASYNNIKISNDILSTTVSSQTSRPNEQPTNLLPDDLILKVGGFKSYATAQSPSSHQSMTQAEDDMELDSEDEGGIDPVINITPLPPPPPPPLPLLPARPITPPPPPPPPPLRSTITAVPQPAKPPVDFIVARPTTVTYEPPSTVIAATPLPPALPPFPAPVPTSTSNPAPVSTTAAELPTLSIPDSTEEPEDDQSTHISVTKRKKQKSTKNKIGLKGMQNLFQKWQQVQENL